MLSPRQAPYRLPLAILSACSLLLAAGCPGESPVDADAGPEDDVHVEEDTAPEIHECNGHADLCDRSFSEVVFPGTHNSMGNAEDGWVAPNQNLPLGAQLADGIRAFLLDTYEEEGEVLLCHAFCALGSRPLLDAMEEFREFLDDHPTEIITIIFEDHIPGARTVEVLDEAGLTELVYTHDADGPWPTLREMIQANTRLVVTNESAGPPPAWLHHVWDLGWDTPYSFESIEEFNCSHNRGTQEGDLFLINHWILDPLPRPATAEESNSYDVLMARVQECQEQWDRLPTFIAIDFHDIGDLFEVVDVLNGLRAPR